MNSIRVLTVVLVVAIGTLQAFGADEQTRQARAVFEKNKDAVVWVTAVVKMEASGGGRNFGKQESKVSALGTIIDQAGMAVVSLSNIDPGSNLDGKTYNGVKLAVTTDISDVKIVLPPGKSNPNGLEVPARIAMKDTDLNLAFIVPDEKAKEKPAVFPFIKLVKAPKLQELDQLVCIGRMAKAMDQSPVVSMSEVASIVNKPRTFIIGGKFNGGPVFTLEGAMVGITTTYNSDNSPAPTAVILPAEDVQEIAEQAKTAKPAPPSTASTASAISESTKEKDATSLPTKN